jgi:ABC-2 type transport system permease protein
MRTLSLLLSPKILSIKNSFTLNAFLKRLPFILIGLFFWLGFYIATFKVLEFIRGIVFFGEILSQKLLSIVFFSLGIFLTLSNIITALSSFYISKDIPFLMSKPIRIRHILGLKTVETITSSSWMVLSFIPPFFIAYGVNYQAPLYFHVMLTFTFISFILISGGIGITLAHLLTRIFSAQKLRLALLAAGLVLFIALYILFRNQWSASSENPDQFLLSFLKIKIESPLLPGFWMTESLMPILNRQSPEIYYPFLTIFIGMVMLMLSGITGSTLYGKSLENIRPSAKSVISTAAAGCYPGEKLAFLWKDIKIFFRDPGQWSQLFIIGALILIYIYNFRTLPLKTLADAFPFIKEFLLLVNMLTAGLVLSAVAARFLYSSISLEGSAFWIIRTSPVTVKKLLLAKYFFGFVPVAAVLFAVVLIANIAMEIDPISSILSAATTLLLCISISGLGVGMGAMYPKFKYENAASISMSPGGMFFMLIAFLVVLLTVSIEAYCLFVYKRALLVDIELTLLQKISFVCAGPAILAINAVALYIPMKLGRKRLEEDLNI